MLQHYGGGTDNAWRRALMIAGGVEETAERAIWNEPDHHMLRLARRKGVVKLLLDRDIKHVISEGIIPDTHHPDESPYVTEVRETRDTGEDGVRRMRGLLDEDEMTLFKSTSSTPPDSLTQGGSRIRFSECGESTAECGATQWVRPNRGAQSQSHTGSGVTH